MANSNELIKTINAEKKQLREINGTLLAKIEEKEAYIVNPSTGRTTQQQFQS